MLFITLCLCGEKINTSSQMSEVENFIFEKEDHQQEILQFLHDLMLSYPEVTDKIRYRVPFYYRKSWICYLNPQKNGSIELVFLRGNELSNASGILNAKGRKQVAGIEIFNTKDIPLKALDEVILEALLLDETVPYASKRKKK